MGTNRRLGSASRETDPTVERSNAALARKTVSGGVHGFKFGRVGGEASERCLDGRRCGS